MLYFILMGQSTLLIIVFHQTLSCPIGLEIYTDTVHHRYILANTTVTVQMKHQCKWHCLNEW